MTRASKATGITRRLHAALSVVIDTPQHHGDATRDGLSKAKAKKEKKSMHVITGIRFYDADGRTTWHTKFAGARIIYAEARERARLETLESERGDFLLVRLRAVNDPVSDPPLFSIAIPISLVRNCTAEIMWSEDV